MTSSSTASCDLIIKTFWECLTRSSEVWRGISGTKPLSTDIVDTNWRQRRSRHSLVVTIDEEHASLVAGVSQRDLTVCMPTWRAEPRGIKGGLDDAVAEIDFLGWNLEFEETKRRGDRERALTSHTDKLIDVPGGEIAIEVSFRVLRTSEECSVATIRLKVFRGVQAHILGDPLYPAIGLRGDA